MDAIIVLVWWVDAIYPKTIVRAMPIVPGQFALEMASADAPMVFAPDE
jgi:hypothetical protein